MTKRKAYAAVTCPKTKATCAIEGACAYFGEDGTFKNLICVYCSNIYGDRRDNVTGVACTYPNISRAPRQ